MFGEELMQKLTLLILSGCLISGCSFVSPKGQGPEEAVRPLSRALSAPTGIDPTQRDCLADAIYHEAKNTGDTGLRAVGHVVMNRVKSGQFPNTVCGVVRHGEDRGRCQFAYRCDGIAETYPDRPAHRRALKLADRFLSSTPSDITGGALFFHASWARPNAFFKSRPLIGKFGGNTFYL